MDVLDQAVFEGDQQRQMSAEQLKAHFENEIVSKLKPRLERVPAEIKSIREYTPVALKVIERVLKTRYSGDQVIGRWCNELQGLTENVQGLERALRDYAALTPKSLLDRRGQYDVNAAPNIRGEISGLLTRGSRGAMERLVEQIEERVAFLMERAAYRRSLTPDKPPEPPGPSVSINIPKAEDKPPMIDVSKRFDPRAPR